MQMLCSADLFDATAQVARQIHHVLDQKSVTIFWFVTTMCVP
jgi:hypothetical protein